MTLFTKITLTLNLFLFFSCIGLASVYRWTDSQGIVHFSDSEKTHKKAILINLPPLPVVKTHKIAPLKLTSERSNRYKPTQQPAVNRCQKLIKKIVSIEKRLSKYHSASHFDQLNSKLKDLRWEKLKNC